MRRKAKCLQLLLILSAILLAGCGKNAEDASGGNENPRQTGSEGAQQNSGGAEQNSDGTGNLPYDAGKVMSADEVIAEAENAHYLSGDAYDDSLYEDTGLLLGGVAPAFIQEHTLEEFPVFEGDEKFFSPISDDYLIGSFETGKTALYEFLPDGSLLSLRGRIVYASEEALLAANKDKDLKADSMSETGYTYHGNVLYYKMGEDALFAAGYYTDKYDLLKIASSGYWDQYLYWFSKPYEDVYATYDSDSWDELLAAAEKNAVQSNKWWNDPLQGDSMQDNTTQNNPSQNGGNAESAEGHLTAQEAEELFRALMTPSSRSLQEYSQLFSDTYPENTISAYYNAAFRLPEEFDYSDLSIVLDEPGFAYVTLLSYTVPENYRPMDKIDNFLFGAPVSFDSARGKWVVGDNDTFFSVYGAAYYSTILTDGAYDAYASGRFFKRYGTPFDLTRPQIYQTVFAGRVMETYSDEDGNLYVTLYFSNDMDADVMVGSLDSLVLMSENGVVAEVGADIYETVSAHGYLYDTLQIPKEYLQIQNFSTIAVQEFIYTVQ